VFLQENMNKRDGVTSSKEKMRSSYRCTNGPWAGGTAQGTTFWHGPWAAWHGRQCAQPARHGRPCVSWAAGLAHDTALAPAGMAARCPHGNNSPPLLASPPPDRISFASARIFSTSPPLLSLHSWHAPSPSTAACRARTRAL
jgi:hypothetical protein